ncbi:hypothetical protein CEXT_180191 [Caerostris extrusa]|uniref:Uncharacterized protein n=1 Tax=Caerostris extrusa TaxID=172846 RepID=A0AAV4Q9K3_CAEEX|nr:hypothetical protein CEXT_180191 [Caerostris extrusa]
MSDEEERIERKRSRKVGVAALPKSPPERASHPTRENALFPREGLRGARRGTTSRRPAQQHGRGYRASRGVTCPAPHLSTTTTPVLRAPLPRAAALGAFFALLALFGISVGREGRIGV